MTELKPAVCTKCGESYMTPPKKCIICGNDKYSDDCEEEDGQIT